MQSKVITSLYLRIDRSSSLFTVRLVSNIHSKVGRLNLLKSSQFKTVQFLAVFRRLEVLEDPSLTVKLQDTKAAAEVKSLQDFYEMLQSDPNRAFYG